MILLHEKNTSNRRTAILILISVVLLIFFTILDLYTGPLKISLTDIFKSFFGIKSIEKDVLLIMKEIRFPRVFTAILAGSALSVSGLQMQTLFKNPLAGPYVLGISSGASLGVAVMIMGAGTLLNFEMLSEINNWSLIISACVGSALVLMLIFAVSLKINDIMTVLILGMLLGSGITSIVSILQYFSDATLLKSFIVWTLGSLNGVNSGQLKILAIVIICGLAISVFSSKILNALLLGETYSKSMGLNVKLSRTVIFLSTSILAGSITAFCGPIGFIGIAVPHISRMIFKTSDHKILMPASIILGAVIMLVSDLVSQLPGYDKILPVNSVTALLGIPVVIFIVLKNFRFSE